MIEPGVQLGHYRILKSLGSGGMADVYEAEDDVLGRRVALKILPPELARNPQLIARFEKEVRAAASLNHRGIVTVFEVAHTLEYHYYSMRLLIGGDLRRRIEQGLTQAQSLALLREVADAFAHAHQRGFVHRDVKPENILFDEQDHPVLTDFGIAKAMDAGASLTAAGMAIGTPRYMSPEQARGKPVDARADLYGLGVILHEMLTRTAPFEADDTVALIFKHMTEPVPRLPAEHLRLQPLLDSLMAKDRDLRPASAFELIRMIDALQPRSELVSGHAARIEVAQPPAPTAQPTVTKASSPTQVMLRAPVAAPPPPEPAAAIAIQEAKPPRRYLAVAAVCAVLAVAASLGWMLRSRPVPVEPPAAPSAQVLPSKAPAPAARPAPQPEPQAAQQPVQPVESSATPATVTARQAQNVRKPAPVQPKPQARPGSTRTRDEQKCTDLRSLFGLGEELTPAQRAYLQENC